MTSTTTLLRAVIRPQFLVSAWPWRDRLRRHDGGLVRSVVAPAVLTEARVGKHIGSVLAKLHLPVSDDTNRRVLAVLTYLRGEQ